MVCTYVLNNIKYFWGENINTTVYQITYLQNPQEKYIKKCHKDKKYNKLFLQKSRVSLYNAKVL